MPTAVSLFSGCGGSDLGLVQAGFEVLMANDVMQYARDVYLANHPDAEFRLGDVSKIQTFPSADLLVGCYPCQGFSQAGARDPSRKINYLYREFFRALRIVNPKAFIVENVSGMKRKDFEHLLLDQLQLFSSGGYTVKYGVLNARDFGVAQERQRLFLVGIRSDLGVEYSFPSAYDVVPTSIREALDGLPDWPEGDFNAEPFHWYYMSRNRRRDWHEQSKTIVAKGRHTPLHPMSPALVRLGPDEWKFATEEPARRFSYREAAVLQGFPVNMSFPDTFGLDLKYRVVGNAVPPPLFRAVAESLPQVW